MRLAIIADDLTGALDAAALFAEIEGGVSVATGLDSLGAALASGPGVVAVSTRSREIDADEARNRVAEAVGSLPPGVRLFKKIDSRLKGNLAAELTVFAGRPLLVAPGIPEFGRVVQDGWLRGFGVDEPLWVAGLLGPAGENATVPDTGTEAGMDEALRHAGAGSVLVGARGLSRALARSMGLAPPVTVGPLPRPLCLAIGSTDPITLAQLENLRAATPDLVEHAAPSGKLAAAPPAELPPVSLLRMAAGGSESAAEAGRRFADSAAPWLRASKAMVLAGGATAEACLDALGIGVLSLRGEALPGLPISTADGKVVVTKSGGFGEADALARLAGPTRPEEG